jgi:uncharacterized protein with HEPN domain
VRQFRYEGVIHAYWGIKPERGWHIIEDDLPPLKIQVEAVLRESNEKRDDEPDFF